MSLDGDLVDSCRIWFPYLVFVCCLLWRFSNAARWSSTHTMIPCRWYVLLQQSRRATFCINPRLRTTKVVRSFDWTHTIPHRLHCPARHPYCNRLRPCERWIFFDKCGFPRSAEFIHCEISSLPKTSFISLAMMKFEWMSKSKSKYIYFTSGCESSPYMPRIWMYTVFNISATNRLPRKSLL